MFVPAGSVSRRTLQGVGRRSLLSFLICPVLHLGRPPALWEALGTMLRF